MTIEHVHRYVIVFCSREKIIVRFINDFSSEQIFYLTFQLVKCFSLQSVRVSESYRVIYYIAEPVRAVTDCICFWEVLNNRTLELLRTMFHNHNRIKTRRCTTRQNKIIKRKFYQLFCKTYPNSKNVKKSQDQNHMVKPFIRH